MRNLFCVLICSFTFEICTIQLAFAEARECTKTLIACDCAGNDGSKKFEIVGTGDLMEACTRMSLGTAPINCRKISSPVICGCYILQKEWVLVAEVSGESGAHTLCTKRHLGSVPFNCR